MELNRIQRESQICEHKDICGYLLDIEREHRISILYAAESGSRAWGFESPNSDYDIRFIYVHRPKEYYLSFDLDRKRDVIECPNPDREWDCKGWDIKKAVYLFTKSNASLFEWMNSPVVYRSPAQPIQELSELSSESFDPSAICYHYWRLAKNNHREFLVGKDSVSLKKYLYVLRAIIATEWVRHEETLPCVNFIELYNKVAKFDTTTDNIYMEIDGLIKDKMSSFEKDTGPSIPVLDEYISRKLFVYDKGFKDINRKDLRLGKWNDELNSIYRLAILGKRRKQEGSDVW